MKPLVGTMRKRIAYVLMGLACSLCIAVVWFQLIVNPESLHLVGQATPDIGRDDLTVDFGVVRPDSEQTHVFQIRNDGAVPIQMRALRTSCGCTTTNSTMHLIQPGAEVPFSVTLRVGSQQGLVVKSVHLEFVDGTERELTLQCEVREPVSLSKKEIVVDYWDNRSLEGRRWSVDVLNYSNQSWTGLDIETSPWLVASQETLDVAGTKATAGYRVSLSVSPDRFAQLTKSQSLRVPIRPYGALLDDAVALQLRFQAAAALRIHPPELAILDSSRTSAEGRLIISQAVLASLDDSGEHLHVEASGPVANTSLIVRRMSARVFAITAMLNDDSPSAGGDFTARVRLVDDRRNRAEVASLEIPVFVSRGLAALSWRVPE